MTRNFAIGRNQERLLGVVADLFAMIGLTEGSMVERLSKPLYRKAHRMLCSAESCVRRLIVTAARDIVVEPKPQRPAPRESESSGESTARDQGKKNRHGPVKRQRPLLFNLFDRPRRGDWGIPGRRPRKRSKIEPRVRLLGDPPDTRHLMFRELGPKEPPPAPPARIVEEEKAVDDGTVSALRLCRRILAMKDALEDIQRHAMRFARWQAKPIEQRRPRRASPIRSGRPPGWRIREMHEVDKILKDCHWLVHETRFDTS
jgi:hypothetical protein